MRSDVVVVVPPERQFAAGIIQSVEDLFIQQLVSQAAIEAFDEAILLRFAGINVMSSNVVIASPLQDRATGKLSPVVTDNAGRFAIDAHKRIQLPCHPGTRDAGISHQT